MVIPLKANQIQFNYDTDIIILVRWCPSGLQTNPTVQKWIPGSWQNFSIDFSHREFDFLKDLWCYTG